MDFPAIYAALAARMKDAPSLAALDGRVIRQNRPAEFFTVQPAMVVLMDALLPQYGAGATPLTWDLSAWLVLHTKSSGDDEQPDDQVGELVAGVEEALRRQDDEQASGGIAHWTTLGGLVEWARLEEVTVEDNVRRAEQVSTIMRVRMLARHRS